MTDDAYRPAGGGGAGFEAEPDLEALRSRLNELQGSVEQLGAQPPEGAPASAAFQPPPTPEAGHPQQPFDHIPPPTYTYQPSQEPPAAEPQAEVGDADAPGLGGRASVPAATNGQSEESGYAITATVAYVDAGQFANLVELHQFEVALTSLDAVRDVRVRRVGGGRAQVEVWMAGAYSLPREMQRLGLPMQVEPGPEGQIVVDLNPRVEDETTVRTD